MSKESGKRKYELMLFYTAVVWGFSTMLSRAVLTETDPFWASFYRFFIATLSLVVIYRKSLKNMTKDIIKSGFIMGFCMSVGFNLYIYGCTLTSLSNAGLLSCISCGFVPVIEFILFGKQLNRISAVSVIVFLAGIYILSGGLELSFNIGDLLALTCSIALALYVVLIPKLEEGKPTELLNIVQLGTVSLTSAVCGIFFNDFSVPQSGKVWACALILGIACTAVCYAFQLIAQQYIEPLETAMIQGLEPVFTAIYPVIFVHDILSLPQWIGLVMICTAAYVIVYQSNKR